ncbi:MAG: Na+:solute symporter [Salibacteraceae bacterium]
MLAWVDWAIIIGFLGLSLAIGLYFRKAAGKGLTDFFLGGRNVPWYVAGLSMVATTFAADTPLAVSELVSQGGIAKNWLWWSFIMGGALTTFFFATLWRRSGVLTELEFITLRYEGKPARLLRYSKSIYLGLIINAIIIAWVNLAMMTLLQVFFELGRFEAMALTFGMMVVALLYSALSGLKGVAVTDMIQFLIAMTGCIILAFLVLNSEDIGGMSGLKSKLPESTFNFFPSIGLTGGSALNGFGLTVGAFLSFVAIQWWASWYPGAEPGGGGYIAQRMMSTRSEKEAVWATLLFQIGHYCIRPWPWILVGLCAIALYAPEIHNPDLYNLLEQSNSTTSSEFLSEYPTSSFENSTRQIEYYYAPRLGFVFAMRDYLPNGLMGLLLTAFIAAYLSTISTQVNWGASYLVNDLWMPLSKTTSEKRLVLISRFASVVVMAAGALVTPFVTSISAVWEFIMQCGAGLGLVLILRWYWWRVNAWSEISATIAPLFGYAFCALFLNETLGDSFTENNGAFYVTVGFTTLVWVSTTFLTPKQSVESLSQFYNRVRPNGIWPISIAPKGANKKELWLMTGGWLSMISTIISVLFAIGSILLLNYSQGILYSAIGVISIFALKFFLKKTNIFDRNSEIT